MRTFYIGRNPDNDIICDNGAVSGRHAELTVGDDGQIVFTDYSTNGSYINGNPIHHASQAVVYGDEIMFPGNLMLDWSLLDIQSQQVDITYNPYAEGGNGGLPPMPPVSDYDNGMFDNGSSQLPNTGRLNFSLAFSEGFANGTRNVLRLLAMEILFVLTCWIPYVNVGTFIAMSTLSAQYATGNAVNPLSIFDSRFRRPMGNFILLQLLVGAVMVFLGIFMFIPAVVIFYSWYLSPLFVVERNLNPLAAMDASHGCTYGYKWTMFAIHLVYGLCVVIILAILIGIEYLVLTNVAGDLWSYYQNMTTCTVITVIFSILQAIFLLFASSIGIGINGSIWRQLKSWNLTA